MAEALKQFVARYPVDEKACALLAGADPAVQGRVLQDFRPHREGDADYSALVTTFTKKVADQLGVPVAHHGPKGADGPDFAWGPGPDALALAALPPGGAPRDLASARLAPGLDAFLARYP